MLGNTKKEQFFSVLFHCNPPFGVDWGDLTWKPPGGIPAIQSVLKKHG